MCEDSPLSIIQKNVYYIVVSVSVWVFGCGYTCEIAPIAHGEIGEIAPIGPVEIGEIVPIGPGEIASY